MFVFCKCLIFCTLTIFFQTNKCLEEILECLLHMLNKEVIDHCKQSVQYFYVLMAYVKTVSILDRLQHILNEEGAQWLSG